MQFPLASSSPPTSFQQHSLLASCYSWVPSSEAWPNFCSTMGFVFSSSFPTLIHTDRGSTVPAAKLLNMHFSTTGSHPLPEQARKSSEVHSDLQFQIAPLKQLSQSQCSSSPVQHINILSLHTWEAVSICSIVKRSQRICLLNLTRPTLLQQVHIAFPAGTPKGLLTSLWESLCASSVFMIVNSA